MIDNLPKYVKLNNAYNPAHYPANKKISAEEWNALWLSVMHQGNHQEDILASILNTTIPENITNINNLINITDSHTSLLAGLRSDVDSNTSRIGFLESFTIDLEGAISNLDSITANHGGRIDNLESTDISYNNRINSLEDIADDHEARVNNLETDVNILKEDIPLKAYSNEVYRHYSLLSPLPSDIVYIKDGRKTLYIEFSPEVHTIIKSDEQAESITGSIIALALLPHINSSYIMQRELFRCEYGDFIRHIVLNKTTWSVVTVGGWQVLNEDWYNKLDTDLNIERSRIDDIIENYDTIDSVNSKVSAVQIQVTGNRTDINTLLGDYVRKQDNTGVTYLTQSFLEVSDTGALVHLENLKQIGKGTASTSRQTTPIPVVDNKARLFLPQEITTLRNLESWKESLLGEALNYVVDFSDMPSTPTSEQLQTYLNNKWTSMGGTTPILDQSTMVDPNMPLSYKWFVNSNAWVFFQGSIEGKATNNIYDEVTGELLSTGALGKIVGSNKHFYAMVETNGEVAINGLDALEEEVNNNTSDIAELQEDLSEQVTALSNHTVNTSNPHSVAFSQLLTKPTTLAGYGITDAAAKLNISQYYIPFRNAAGSGEPNSSILATIDATPSTVVARSSDGKASIVAGTSTDHIVNKGQLDAVQGNVDTVQSNLNTHTENTDIHVTTGAQNISGLKTFNAPTNIAGTEQATTWFNTANGGRVGFGKEGPNSGTGIFFEQVVGTRRLNFRGSATPGAMVWSQPEEGAQLCIDLGIAGIDYRRITMPASAGRLALTNQLPTKTSDLTNDSGFITEGGIDYLKDPDKTYLVIKTDIDNDTFTLLTRTSGSPNYTIEWGDGESENITGTADPTHEYETAGMYLITISGAFTNGILYGSSANVNKNKIIEVYGGSNYPLVTGDYAFRDCKSLTAVNFPNATSIGIFAFNSCTSLTTANFPNATNIGDYSFYQCTSLTTANFPNATDSGTGAFQDCTSLATANFPNATSIGHSAFNRCTSLTELTLGNVTTTGTGIRFEYVKLVNLTIAQDATDADIERIKQFYADNGGSFTGTPSIAIPFASLVNKPATISGYGIADAYTETEINTLLTRKAVQPYIQRSYGAGNGVRLIGIYNYSTSVGDTRPLFYLAGKQGHGNGTSYLWQGEFIFGVSTTGVVTAKSILTISDGTYGKFYYRHDTVNKILYIYVYTGQYSSAYFSDLIQINAGNYSSYFTLASAGSVTGDTIVEGVNILYPTSSGTIALTSQLDAKANTNASNITASSWVNKLGIATYTTETFIADLYISDDADPGTSYGAVTFTFVGMESRNPTTGNYYWTGTLYAVRSSSGVRWNDVATCSLLNLRDAAGNAIYWRSGGTLSHTESFGDGNESGMLYWHPKFTARGGTSGSGVGSRNAYYRALNPGDDWALNETSYITVFNVMISAS